VVVSGPENGRYICHPHEILDGLRGLSQRIEIMGPFRGDPIVVAPGFLAPIFALSDILGWRAVTAIGVSLSFAKADETLPSLVFAPVRSAVVFGRL
jgi:hypothetical protein